MSFFTRLFGSGSKPQAPSSKPGAARHFTRSELLSYVRGQIAELPGGKSCIVRAADRTYKACAPADALSFLGAAQSGKYLAELNDCEDMARAARCEALTATLRRALIDLRSLLAQREAAEAAADSAFALHPWAFGYAETKTHALNVALGPDARLYFADFDPIRILRPADLPGPLEMILF